MDESTPVLPHPSTSNSSEWHSIRPWTPHLTLVVREITSVSATFILSSSLDARHTTDNEPELAGSTPNDANPDAVLDSRGVIADALAHGLSVDVNGSNWQRVILRMNDHADEAIIVIYGLHPGRQYDIDLALVSGETMRKQVTTEDAESTTLDHERSDDLHIIAAPEMLSASTVTNECVSPAPSASQVPTPEEHLRTLSHQLSALHAEQATLQAALKSSRRDANKTTTNLRTDIEGLKRASEKAGIAEGKARQRVRALEDAVRRANEGREQVEQMTAVDEQDLVGLKAKLSEAEDVLTTVKREADTVRADREKREEEERKRQESLKGECATLNQRLERLTVKKERLENSVILDLEAQLTDIEREIEIAERDGFQNGDTWDNFQGDPLRAETQLRRQSHPGSIVRPHPQRTSQPPISPPQFSRHQPRSQSVYRTSDLGVVGVSHPPGLAHPTLHASSSSISHPGSSGVTHSAVTASHATNTIFSTASSLSRSTSSVSSSTLSSKALPFEPTRKLQVSLSSPTTSGLPPAGILAVSNPSSFSPSSSTFATTGSSSGFPVPSTYSPTQRTPQVSSKGYDAELGSNQAQSDKSTQSKGSGGEDPRVTPNS